MSFSTHHTRIKHISFSVEFLISTGMSMSHVFKCLLLIYYIGLTYQYPLIIDRVRSFVNTYNRSIPIDQALIIDSNNMLLIRPLSAIERWCISFTTVLFIYCIFLLVRKQIYGITPLMIIDTPTNSKEAK